MNREMLERIIETLEAGGKPVLDSADFPVFAQAEAAGRAHVSVGYLEELSKALTADDIPTFKRALQALEARELAWLGFKVVYDPAVAVTNVDNAVTKKYGDQGSADGAPLVFFCNDEKQIVASREPSPRDIFQMKDATRGPSMHCEQFEGLTWMSVPLFEQVHVWLLGATDASSEVAALAAHVGFRVTAVDCDAAYLSEERFPDAERILLAGEDFSGLDDLEAAPEDYVCVLTRGHMFDPEGCLWAARWGVRYAGMMGCAGKNGKVYDLVKAAGMTDEQWDAIKRPIGLKFGAKTPAELAIAIVAELVDVRYRDRYSEEARAGHDRALGR